MALSNTYQGPLTSFAMVVPVPAVLRKDQVKTLWPKTFEHIEQLTAPRLVEYWEQDPCARPMDNAEDMPEKFFVAKGDHWPRASSTKRRVAK